jgi:hypothetical protein
METLSCQGLMMCCQLLSGCWKMWKWLDLTEVTAVKIRGMSRDLWEKRRGCVGLLQSDDSVGWAKIEAPEKRYLEAV